MSAGHIIRPRLTVTTWNPKPPRLVHAARARKLRRRGEAVKFVGYTVNGKAAYEWTPAPKAQPYQQRLFGMLQRLEDDWLRDDVDEGSELLQMAQQRTKTFAPRRVIVTMTPKGEQSIAQWAAQFLTLPPKP